MELNEVLEERKKTHGDWKQQSRLSQVLKGIIRQSEYYSKLSLPQCEALDMILHKVSRIVEGNPNEKDHWLDIAGYATLETR